VEILLALFEFTLYYPGLIFIALFNGLISRFLLAWYMHNIYLTTYVDLKFKFSILGSFVLGLFSYLLVSFGNALYEFFPLNQEVVMSDYFFYLLFCTIISLYIERRNIYYKKNN
tara:strand:- start:329 stop:670 length:342 start_codon:yes stop_codon:yes gene_type:complete